MPKTYMAKELWTYYVTMHYRQFFATQRCYTKPEVLSEMVRYLLEDYAIRVDPRIFSLPEITSPNRNRKRAFIDKKITEERPRVTVKESPKKKKSVRFTGFKDEPKAEAKTRTKEEEEDRKIEMDLMQGIYPDGTVADMKTPEGRQEWLDRKNTFLEQKKKNSTEPFDKDKYVLDVFHGRIIDGDSGPRGRYVDDDDSMMVKPDVEATAVKTDVPPTNEERQASLTKFIIETFDAKMKERKVFTLLSQRETLQHLESLNLESVDECLVEVFKMLADMAWETKENKDVVNIKLKHYEFKSHQIILGKKGGIPKDDEVYPVASSAADKKVSIISRNSKVKKVVSSDLLEEFVDTCCHYSQGDHIKCSDLFDAYEMWCRTMGCELLSKSRFRTEMRKYFVVPVKDKTSFYIYENYSLIKTKAMLKEEENDDIREI